jgi:RNase H-like domain found in reverse transcriptase
MHLNKRIARDMLFAYPNHNKMFDIETDASDYQLSAIIKQDNRPIAYYTRKLNLVQKNYTTIKKELLSIVKTLKEFQSMLLGAPITIYTDHKNLTHKLSSFSTQHVLQWRLLLEEFGCNYKYNEGSQNLICNSLSHIPTSCLVREKTAGPGEKNLISQPNQPQEPYKDNQACIAEENPLLAECLLVYPVFDEHDVTHHPFHFAMMQHYQQRSDVTKQLLIDQPEQYAPVTLGETDLICYIANLQQPKIVLTDDMLPQIVRYYHLTAQHAKGMDRLEWLLK